MTKVLEGMARAAHSRLHRNSFENETAAYRHEMEGHMRAALLWLADNVSDEMVDAARNSNWHNVERSAIAAALRQAASQEDK